MIDAVYMKTKKAACAARFSGSVVFASALPPFEKIADERKHERGGQRSERSIGQPAVLVERAYARRQACAFDVRLDESRGSQRYTHPQQNVG